MLLYRKYEYNCKNSFLIIFFFKCDQNFTSADQLEAIMRLWVVRLSHNRGFTDKLVVE